MASKERLKRGPYKKYLRDPSVKIPDSTKRYRLYRQNKVVQVQCGNQNEEDGTISSDENLSIKSDSYNNFSEEEVTVSHFNIENLQSNVSAEEPYNQSSNLLDTDDSSWSYDSASTIDSQTTDEDNANYYNEYLLSDDDGTYDGLEQEMQVDDEERLNLYDNCSMTRQESEILLMSFALRHSLPDIGIENLVNTIDCHLPHVEYKSKYRFLKAFKQSEMIDYYYCPDCYKILNSDSDNIICNYCDKHYTKKFLKTEDYFFLNIPLEKQLRELLNSELYLDLRKQCNESDVINGRVYRQLQNMKIINDNDITIQWNVDGVNLCKSSKKSMWPILVLINELNYRKRKNNIMLCGLWYGEKKPPMNLYLEPFVNELQKLYNDGMECIFFGQTTTVKIKIHTLFCTVDSVARPMVQNMKQFNGAYGCSYCLHKGQQTAVRRGKARTYNFSKHTERSSSIHQLHLEIAVRTGETEKGVKGPSICALIPGLDIINGYPPDYMHCCLLGVAKLFVTAWFDSSNNQKSFYLGHKETEFNRRLASIKPPTEITRTPKPLTDKYKANEWKNFVLYYSIPCLKGLMKQKYIDHWYLFVFGLNVFLKECVSDNDFIVAKAAFTEFVKNVEVLYGMEYMKFNVHLLLHIPKYVKNYGALWAWSAFPFEGFNGVIKKLFHGTQFIPLQISKAYNRLRYIKNNSYIFNNEECSQKVINQFLKLMNQCSVKNCIEYDDDLKIFGKPRIIKLTLSEKVAAENHLHEAISENCFTHHRFIYKHVLFHSKNYNRLKKRDNSIILTIDNTILVISSLLKVTLINSNENKYIILGSKLTDLNIRLSKYKTINSQKNMFVTQETSNISCIDITAIQSKCVCITYKNRMYENNHPLKIIIPIINKFETD